MIRRLIGISGLAVLGCATLASEAGDEGVQRPSALAGPFRYAVEGELDDAPYTLKKKHSDHRQPALLPGATEDEPSVLYVVASVANQTGIFRYVAADGRSFGPDPEPAAPVVTATEVFEGGEVASPSLARVGGEIHMAYATATGIALARSSDGISFDKPSGVALGVGGEAWEAGQVPAAPALLVSDAGVHLFYAAGGRIGEATSPDGQSFSRVGAPVLEPGAAEAFDAAGVGDPDAWLATTGEGRRVTRVYYTAAASDGSTAIGLAARFGTQGPLTRASAPALTGPRGPREPAVLPRSGHTLLFVTQRAGSGDSQDFPAIALGVAPATLRLSAP